MKIQNRLAKASSPYLRQHADNPVDWYEWSEEALQKAKAEHKPLLISIGYAACHWCHVMAYESFSDYAIASYMNEHFVCVKVDREERPDIDQIYMDAAHIISGRGGWPLNVVTLPDGRPFYAATYFPLHQWLNVLQQLHAVFENDQSRVLKAAASITKGIESHPFSEVDIEKHFSKESYYQSFENHIQNVDFEWGGYRKAPKFMMAVGLEFFLQYHFLTGNETALQAVRVSLDAMAQGGLNDQLGGGFARYSTDEKWLVPHFEKMLYDNAQLIGLYAKTYQITKSSFYKSTFEKIIAFVERELSDDRGGFYASIDADSEHEEGKFYVFTKEEITSVLDKNIAHLIIEFYNITDIGNWEAGKNILHYTTDKEEFCTKHGLLLNDFKIVLNNANQQLFNFRSKRIRPTTDDKIVCSWNALMISGYVSAFKATGNENHINSALRTCRFVERELMKNDGSLLRIFKDGKATIDAFLDDYALLAQAFIDIYEVTFDFHWLEQSNSLANFVWSHFSNESRDMFYYTADTAKGLITRKYECSDNVIPASNSVLANVFYRLGILFTNNEYISTAEKMLSRVLNETIEYGSYYANWAMLLGKLAFPDFEVAILGENALEKAREMYRNYLPTVTFAGGIQEQLPLMKNRLVNGKTMIYVCENNSCQLPVEKTENALKTIKGTL